jgi:hypothetical protein
MRFFLLIRTWIISILLAGAVVFFGYKTFEVWSTNDKLEVNKPDRKSPRPRARSRIAYHRNPPYKTYEVVAQKNLFSSDRREKSADESSTLSGVKPAKSLDSRFALFGIVINGKEKKALVSNLENKNAKNKKYIWVKVGDRVGNLNISEIKSGHVIITQGGSTYAIPLSDRSYPEKRSTVRKVKKRTGTRTIEIKKPKVKSPAAKRLKASS